MCKTSEPSRLKLEKIGPPLGAGKNDDHKLLHTHLLSAAGHREDVALIQQRNMSLSDAIHSGLDDIIRKRTPEPTAIHGKSAGRFILYHTPIRREHC